MKQQTIIILLRLKWLLTLMCKVEFIYRYDNSVSTYYVRYQCVIDPYKMLSYNITKSKYINHQAYKSRYFKNECTSNILEKIYFHSLYKNLLVHR